MKTLNLFASIALTLGTISSVALGAKIKSGTKVVVRAIDNIDESDVKTQPIGYGPYGYRGTIVITKTTISNPNLFVIDKDVYDDTGKSLVIPEGQLVYGELDQSPGSFFSEPGWIMFSNLSVNTIDGKRVPLTGKILVNGEKDTKNQKLSLGLKIAGNSLFFLGMLTMMSGMLTMMSQFGMDLRTASMARPAIGFLMGFLGVSTIMGSTYFDFLKGKDAKIKKNDTFEVHTIGN